MRHKQDAIEQANSIIQEYKNNLGEVEDEVVKKCAIITVNRILSNI